LVIAAGAAVSAACAKAVEGVSNWSGTALIVSISPATAILAKRVFMKYFSLVVRGIPVQPPP
jgi:hypothetical protein